MPRKYTTEDFKQKLSLIHPNLELLSEYKGSYKYIEVRCKIHDYVYKTKPKWLVAGNGCQKCYDERRGETTRKTTEQFIEEARMVHGNKYDYSKVVYVNNQTKVCIICPEHGEFWQTPDKHITRKQGCPKCAGREKTTESVIEEFIKVHGYKYDYSKVVYINNRTKVCIICPKHGEFWQRPDKHLQGEGCPICKESKLEILVRNYLSENNILFESQKHFDWLGRQSLDFYLPEYNVAIECQGEQHFCKSYGIYLKKSSLADRVERDTTKNTLCRENNVNLLYVMNERWLDKCESETFNGIYKKSNIITSNEISKLNEKLISG